MEHKIKEYWLRNAVWDINASKLKTVIKATKETVNVTTGEISRKVFIINKHNKDGSINKNYQEVIDHVTIKRIDSNTRQIIKQQKSMFEEKDQQEKDRKKTQELEKLFQSKINALEIQEVKDCKDRKIKSRIRRAKTPLEVSIFAAVAAIRSEEELTPVPKKTTKRKSTAKKPATKKTTASKTVIKSVDDNKLTE